MAHFNPELLEQLISIRGASGDEEKIRDFILDHVDKHKADWKKEPEVYFGDGSVSTTVVTAELPATDFPY